MPIDKSGDVFIFFYLLFVNSMCIVVSGAPLTKWMILLFLYGEELISVATLRKWRCKKKVLSGDLFFWSIATFSSKWR